MSKSLLLLLFLFSPTFFYGQQYYFRNLNLEHGLPQSQAYDILQTTRGVIWIATNGGGACRYLGSSFEILNQHKGLVDDHVRRILEDSKGNLWFATYYGLTKYDGESFLNIGVDQGFQECVFLDIYEDHEGRIWLYLQHDKDQSSIYYVNQNKLVNFSNQEPSLRRDALVSVLYKSSLFQLPDKTLLVLGKHGLQQINTDLSVKQWSQNQKIGDAYARPLFVKANKSILFLRNSKLVEFDGSSVREIKLPSSINPIDILQITEGIHGELWLAVNRLGLIRILKDGTYKIFDDQNGFEGSNSYIYKLFTDREGSIWIGTSNKGVYQFIEDRFLHFNQKDGLSSLDVTALFKTDAGIALGLNDGNVYEATNSGSRLLINGAQQELGIVKAGLLVGDELWLGTSRGLQSWKNGKLRNKGKEVGIESVVRISSIALQGETIWIGSNENGLVRIRNNEVKLFNDTNSDLPSNDTRYIFVDSKNRIWLCTNFGLAKINDQGVPEVINLPIPNQKTLIFQAAEDSFGNIWFATFGQGLIRYNGSEFSILSTKQGLSSNIIYSITSENKSELWCSVQNALHKIEVDKEGAIRTLETYNNQNGFFGFEGNGAAILSLNDHQQIWIGTVKGAFVYNSLPRVSIDFLQASVQSIKLFYADVDWKAEPFKKYYNELSAWSNIPEGLELPPDQNHITFSIAIPSYRYPAGIKMQWMLSGSHTTWSPLTSSRDIVYSDLDPGYYALDIRVLNEQGELGEVQRIFTFTILPPFYESWWFVMLASIFTLLLLIVIVRAILRRRYVAELKRMEAQQQVQQERQRIARDLHDHVGSQLTYIINGLDSVSTKQEATDSKGRLSELSKFAREAIHQLRETIWATHKESFTVIELEQRLRRLAWMYMEQDAAPQILVQTFGDLNIKLRPVQVLNLFRIAQEAINNAVRHSQGSQIMITISVVSTKLSLIVEDDGVGIDEKVRSKSSGGFGFSSMNQRVEEIGGELIVQSMKGKGTKIEVRILAHNHLK